MPRSRWLAVGPLLLLLTNSALAKEQAAIVEIDAPAAIEEHLAVSLPRSEALSRRWLVLGPAELRARLQRLPSVQKRLTQARLRLSAAKQHLMRIERGQALAEARDAASLLADAGCRFHSPELLAQAMQLEARALLLEPADERGAREALKRALQAQPDLQPDLQRMSPRLAGLLTEVRRQHTARRSPPDQDTLHRLADWTDVPWLIWIGVDPAGQRARVSLILYGENQRLLVRRTNTLDRASPDRQIAALLSRTLDRAAPSEQPARSFGKEQRGDFGKPAPWYRRWWFWAAVGTAVVGGALAVGLSVSRDPRGYDVEFRY